MGEQFVEGIYCGFALEKRISIRDVGVTVTSLPTPTAKGRWREMKVYCVLDDSIYPSKLISIFAQEKDAKDFAYSVKDYIVEEYEVIP